VGLVLFGDSAGAHFHIPDQWLSPADITQVSVVHIVLGGRCTHVLSGWCTHVVDGGYTHVVGGRCTHCLVVVDAHLC